jgi:hypothetical protein
MSTTEDTTTIDEKKEEESGTSTTDFKGFISNYLSSIIFTIGISIFVIGGLGLYTTKVAQSNILPDNIDLAPYTIIDRIVKDIPIDINIMRPSLFSENKDTLSQKAIFNSQEYLDSFNKSLLCSLKKSANPDNGLFANASLFFSKVYDNLVAKNFLVINSIFFYLSYLPESVIMFLYGIFGIFLWIGLYFFNVCISIFYHIINIPQLFRDVQQPQEGLLSGFFGEEQKSNGLKWESTEDISFLRFTKIILFFFIWIPVGAFSTFVSPLFFTLYSLMSPLYATYKVKQTNKTFNIIDFIKDTFAYKTFFFFVLATLSLFSNGIKYLGTNAIIGIVVAVIFAYFMGLYTNEMPNPGTDGFSLKIRQTMKQASVADLTNTKLVQICESIPIEDKKIDKILQNGQFRNLTKPTEVGGDIDAGSENIPLTNEPNLQAEPLTNEPNLQSESLTNEPNLQSESLTNEPNLQAESLTNEPNLQSESLTNEPKLQAESLTNEPNLQAEPLITTPLTAEPSLENKLNELKTQLAESEKNINNESDAFKNYALQAKLQPEIEKLEQQLKTQTGGQKYKQKHKKYDIKWT